MAKWVNHDGQKWKVVNEIELDEQPAFSLTRRFPTYPDGKFDGWVTRGIVAYQRDCEPVTAERKRRFRDEDGVIEFDGRGNVTLRQKGGRKRYTTTIKGLIFLCAQSQATIKKREKDFAKRTKRRKG